MPWCVMMSSLHGGEREKKDTVQYSRVSQTKKESVETSASIFTTRTHTVCHPHGGEKYSDAKRDVNPLHGRIFAPSATPYKQGSSSV